MEGLARLKVDGPILHLQQHVRRELAVEGLEIVIGRRSSIVTGLRVVDEGPPDHHSFVRSESRGQHVGAINMVAIVGARPWLALAVSLNQEATKIRNGLVNLIRLFLPPGCDFPVERISGLQATQFDGRRKARREINMHAIRAEGVGNGCDLM